MKIKFEPRDLWVGVYWNIDRHDLAYQSLNIYICIIPMFPICLQFPWAG